MGSSPNQDESIVLLVPDQQPSPVRCDIPSKETSPRSTDAADVVGREDDSTVRRGRSLRRSSVCHLARRGSDQYRPGDGHRADPRRGGPWRVRRHVPRSRRQRGRLSHACPRDSRRSHCLRTLAHTGRGPWLHRRGHSDDPAGGDATGHPTSHQRPYRAKSRPQQRTLQVPPPPLRRKNRQRRSRPPPLGLPSP